MLDRDGYPETRDSYPETRDSDPQTRNGDPQTATDADAKACYPYAATRPMPAHGMRDSDAGANRNDGP